MKLILTHEVAGLGEPGDVIEVKDGYGRNYLVPRGYAMVWTRGGEKQIATIRRARKVREVRDLDHATALKRQLEALSVRLAAKAGNGGRLFGSVTTAEVAAAVRASGGPELDRRRIVLPRHIKETGRHNVSVRIHPEVTAEFAVDVVPA